MVFSNVVVQMDERQLINEGEQASTATVDERSFIQSQNTSNNNSLLDELFQRSALYRAEKKSSEQDSIEIDPIIRPH